VSTVGFEGARSHGGHGCDLIGELMEGPDRILIAD